MACGGFLSAHCEREYYDSEKAREEKEILECPEMEVQEIKEIFDSFNPQNADLGPLIESIISDPQIWVAFMLKFELGLDKPPPISR